MRDRRRIRGEDGADAEMLVTAAKDFMLEDIAACEAIQSVLDRAAFAWVRSPANTNSRSLSSSATCWSDWSKRLRLSLNLTAEYGCTTAPLLAVPGRAIPALSRCAAAGGEHRWRSRAVLVGGLGRGV